MNTTIEEQAIKIKNSLQFCNDSPNGGINDTLWMTEGSETIFDAFDAMLADMRRALLLQGEPQKPIAYLAMTYTQDINAREDGFEVCSKFDSGAFPVYISPPSTEALQKDNAELFGISEQLKKDKVELIEYVKKLRNAIDAMANNGWMYCGPEGLDTCQQKVFDVLAIPQPQCMEQ